MATLMTRVRRDGTKAYRVKWRLGGRRDAMWQSETFDDRRAAVKFQARVEALGHEWPEGWVKGFGYIAAQPEETSEEHPFVEFAAAYVRRLTSAGPDTQTRYLKQVGALAGWLRAVKRVEPTVENITADDDRDWVNLRRRAGASPKTIANYHGLLSAVFNNAVDKGLITRNPCAGVKLPPVDDDTENDDDKMFLNEDEFALIHRCMHPDDRDFVLVAVGTGARWGELTALKVKDLRLGDAVPSLTVRRAWKRNGEGEFALDRHGRFYLGKPKTKESRRRITLAPVVVFALRRAIKDRGPDELVFGAPRGGRLDQGNWYESRWLRALTAAQEQGLTKSPRFHDLRHTHAAWLISGGVPLPVIQKRLGHKSIQITVDVYGGLLFQTHEIADMTIQRALGGDKIVTLTGSNKMEAAELIGDDEDRHRSGRNERSVRAQGLAGMVSTSCPADRGAAPTHLANRSVLSQRGGGLASAVTAFVESLSVFLAAAITSRGVRRTA